jgi:hypothetical protein
MTEHYKISRRINWIVLLCFFLPFFEYKGCSGIGFGQSSEQKAAEEAAKEQAMQDSIAASKVAILETKSDTINQTVINQETEPVEIINDTTSYQETKVEIKTTPEKDKISTLISNEHPILKPLLNIRPNYYSGIAYLLDTSAYLLIVFILFSFVFLTLCLIIKYIDKEARKAICLLEILSLGCLYYTPSYIWIEGFDILSGFWISLLALTILTIYDIYIAILKNKAAHNMG